VIVVDDRRDEVPTPLPVPSSLAGRVTYLRTTGRHGPAAARNVGWRASDADWVAFLDDDVVTPPCWLALLGSDVAFAHDDTTVAGVQGSIVVPVPSERPATDWERDVAGLERAAFATADLVYRRAALEQAGGFDELFPLAYREDADLALRLIDDGLRITGGRRFVVHPVPPADRWISVRRQRGNASDARMRMKHGRDWRARAAAPRGRLPMHAVTVACGALALGARGRIARVAALAWAALTLQFTLARLRPGPRSAAEIVTIALTSVVIPPCAVFHRLRGEIAERARINAVLFDRDGTLVVDVPYNGDAARVRPAPGAERALARLRAHGVRVAMITNQSGVARGLLTHQQVEDVNLRVDELLGPIDATFYCPHDDGDACACRKPAPGMVYAAAARLGCPPHRAVVVGDTAADVLAAQRAGSHGILVPNERTRREEVVQAEHVAENLDAAVDLVLGTEA